MTARTRPGPRQTPQERRNRAIPTPGRIVPAARLLGRLARSRTGGAAPSRPPGRVAPESRLLGRLARSRTGGAASSRPPGRIVPAARLLGRPARSRTGGAGSSRPPGRVARDSRLLGRLRRMPRAPSVVFRQMERRCICRFPADGTPLHLSRSGRCSLRHLPGSGGRPAPHRSFSGGRCCTAYNRRPRARCLRAGVSCGNLSQKETTHAPAARSMRWGLTT